MSSNSRKYFIKYEVYNHFIEGEVLIKYFENRNKLKDFVESEDLILSNAYDGSYQGPDGAFFLREGEKYYFFFDEQDFIRNSGHLYLIHDKVFIRSFSDIEIDRLFLFYKYEIVDDIPELDDGVYVCYFSQIDKYIKVEIVSDDSLEKVIRRSYINNYKKYGYAILFDNKDDYWY